MRRWVGTVHAEIRGVKILDLGRDLDLEVRGIEFGDGADASTCRP